MKLIFCLLTLSLFAYENTEAFAIQCDTKDELASFRKEFHLPDQIYFCGHSLGLEPKGVSALMQKELDAWGKLGVEGHFKEEGPWYTYHELVREPLARLVGAKPKEVVAMNSLTVNLHLMMISFYQPTPSRYKILMEAPVFSSDTYAAKSQIELRGYDSDRGLIIIEPREGEDTIRQEDLDALLDERGDEIALVLLSAINYFSGQALDLEHIAEKAHDKGCLVGFDLAHAIGNIPLHLHEANVDFAAWCSYKYLNSGPGAIGGAFIHERHLSDTLQRLAGWWGNDPNTRFQLHLEPNFIPVESADSWQISNPSIFSLVPLRASLSIFDRAGIEKLHTKSKELTGYLSYLIDEIHSDQISVITPKDARGAMLSIRVHKGPELLMKKLQESGISCDFRRPNVLRITPAPLYNTFHEVWQFAQTLKNHVSN